MDKETHIVKEGKLIVETEYSKEYVLEQLENAQNRLLNAQADLTKWQGLSEQLK